MRKPGMRGLDTSGIPILTRFTKFNLTDRKENSELPSKEHKIEKGRRENAFTVEKTDKHHLSQVT